ncbi:uncharacterized protein LOC135463390 [Liolophura sinensis]|uniref:uncharacterized protein LOC135463390 n=1 Tax=Liolophura sinensis TaxID=3198878 RepID=UPI0031589AA8
MFLFRMHCAILLFHRVNSVTKVERTVEEIKKKWSDLSSQVKRKEARRRADARKTGGGAPMEEPSDMELKMTVVKMNLPWVKAPKQHHLNQTHLICNGFLFLKYAYRTINLTHAFEDYAIQPSETPSAVQVLQNKVNVPTAKKVPPTQTDRLEELEKQRLAVERERLQIEKARFTLEQHRFNFAVAQSGISEWPDLATILLQQSHNN